MKSHLNIRVSNRYLGIRIHNHELAIKLNEIIQIGICSIVLMMFLAPPLVMAQAPKDYNPAILADWENGPGNRGHARMKIKSINEVLPEFKEIWVDLYRKDRSKSGKGIISGLIHAVHDEGDIPYAVITLRYSGLGNPYILALPKAIFTDEGWEVIKKHPINNFAAKWKYTIPGPPGKCDIRVGLPVDRTITDTQGRMIDATITNIKNGMITLNRKGDRSNIEFPIAKLSEADQKFIKENINPDKHYRTGPKVLITEILSNITPERRALWEKENIRATFLVSNETDYMENVISLKDIADHKMLLEEYDALWITSPYGHKSDTDLITMMNSLNKPVVMAAYTKLNRKKLLRGEESGSDKDRNVAFVATDDNFIFYRETTFSSKEMDDKTIQHPEEVGKAIKELLRLVK